AATSASWTCASTCQRARTDTEGAIMSRLPLEGVRVVALEQYISGPYCTMWLADAGAEVIKVERPKTGDPRRVFQPELEGENGETLSGGFLSFNRNKRSVTLDLQSPEGIEAYRKLVAS